MICQKCQSEAVKVTVLDKDSWYCRICKDDADAGEIKGVEPCLHSDLEESFRDIMLDGLNPDKMFKFVNKTLLLGAIANYRRTAVDDELTQAISGGIWNTLP